MFISVVGFCFALHHWVVYYLLFHALEHYSLPLNLNDNLLNSGTFIYLLTFYAILLPIRIFKL